MLLRLSALLCFMLTLPARADTPLVVFAAASLAGPLDQAAELWEGEVTISYAGSALLARQAQAGAQADVVILANTDWMAVLVDADVVAQDAVRPMLSNQLALVVHGERGNGGDLVAQLDSLPDHARIATGLVEAVPVGIYARQTLQSIGRYDELRGRLVQVENARVALALVGRGDVEAALIYRSDAQADLRVQPIAWIDPGLHDPIIYPVAPLLRSEHPDTERFLAFLLADTTMAIFEEAGFEPVNE